ncbi:integration host factor subunit beta [Legionella brunensis]|nr:integration host factor subunit beta [Legionella brunensis]
MCPGDDTPKTRLTEVGMIKSQLIANLAAKMTHLPEKQVTDSINRILELMSQALIDGKRIEIRGFGSFSLHYRPPRNAHNPKTGEKVITQEKYSPHFKPGKELRERVDASRGKVKLQDKDE